MTSQGSRRTEKSSKSASAHTAWMRLDRAFNAVSSPAWTASTAGLSASERSAFRAVTSGASSPIIVRRARRIARSCSFRNGTGSCQRSASASIQAARAGAISVKFVGVAGRIRPLWASAMPSRQRLSPFSSSTRCSTSRRCSIGRALSTQAENSEVPPSTARVLTVTSSPGQASARSARASTPRHMVASA